MRLGVDRPGGGQSVRPALTSERLQLQVDRTYRELEQQIRAGAASSDDEREHVLTLVGAARLFIASLDQRLQTVRRVTQVVANAQAEFVAHGPAQLVPLTRLEVARRLRLHESTVGRAVAGKHAILPSGEVVALETFFDGAQPVRLALEQLIAAEDPRRPLSDEALAQRLAELGFDVARRTVAKYRGLLRIPTASARKRAS